MRKEERNMKLIKIVEGEEFLANAKDFLSGVDESDHAEVTALVSKIISAVHDEGDSAVRRYAECFEKDVPVKFEIPAKAASEAWEKLKSEESGLASSLAFAADHIRRFGKLQKEQFVSFETEIEPGLFTGQKVIPVESSAIYVPSGRFPLLSTALMGLIPAEIAGVKERILVSPPGDDGLPNKYILAAAYIAGVNRIFALGGAQAIAAFALGTETIPQVDLIVGPGNKYVTAAKQLLYGEVGIDFVAGPTDVLIITDVSAGLDAEKANLVRGAADLIAADMLAQAEHDPNACARVLVPDREMADQIVKALENRLESLPTAEIALASLNSGGLIIIYNSREEAMNIANRIAPEHLELHVSSPDEWTGESEDEDLTGRSSTPSLRNYGSLFIGSAAGEVLGDYTAGINHTLPTSGSARFTGGLSVRNFLKVVTTLRCNSSKNYKNALVAAETMAKAEGLAGHAESAALRIRRITPDCTVERVSEI